MTIWNVRRSVVELIEAETADMAQRILGRRIRDAGLEPYEDDDFEIFESEEP